MTDKEKLERMLPYSSDRLEDIVAQYLRLHSGEFQPSRLLHFIRMLEMFLSCKLESYELALGNSFEKARFIKDYLEGRTFKDEEAARANVGAQIKNADSIIDMWYMATERRVNAKTH